LGDGGQSTVTKIVIFFTALPLIKKIGWIEPQGAQIAPLLSHFNFKLAAQYAFFDSVIRFYSAIETAVPRRWLRLMQTIFTIG
jgi:hypothetical protein